MTTFVAGLAEDRDALRRHPIVGALLAVLLIAVSSRAAMTGSFFQAAVYLGAIAVSLLLIHVALAWAPPRPWTTRVRQPGFELAVTALMTAGALAWLCGRFVWHYQPPAGPMRLTWMVLLIGCVFDAFLLLFLLARRYGVKDLGLRVAGLVAAPVVIAVFAASALVLTNSTVTWSQIVEDTGGAWTAVLLTALSAAVPEEFFRFVWQTRAAAVFNNRAAGWLLASCVWASLHGPKDWDDAHSLASTAMGIVNIIPLGLLWGYVTYRTRSILPSILIHATNVWGLQNLP